MVIFDNHISFEGDDMAVIWARVDGARIKVCVTKEYAQRTWRIRYSQEEMITKIWLSIEDLGERAARACADGKTELVL